MRQFRLRSVLFLVAVIAVSIHLGGCLEREKQRQIAQIRAAARPVTFHSGAFW